MRDFIKDENYFTDYLGYVDSSIHKFQLAIEKVKNERGGDDPGVQNGYSILNNRYVKKLRALYSAGRPIEEIETFMPTLIDSMEKTWNGKDYEQMLWVLSVGVMLELDNELFDRIVVLVRKYNLQDPLIEFLIQGKLKDTQTFEGKGMLTVPYNKLFEVIQTDNKQVQMQELKEYLEKYWYEGNEDAGWYDTHKHRDDIYSGYWSFESGAIAKILGLNDESLKNVPYYPYDMVHYKG
jgi:hypothetical protein